MLGQLAIGHGSPRFALINLYQCLSLIAKAQKIFSVVQCGVGEPFAAGQAQWVVTHRVARGTLHFCEAPYGTPKSRRLLQRPAMQCKVVAACIKIFGGGQAIHERFELRGRNPLG